MDYRGGLKAMYNNPSWLVQTSLIGLCFAIPFVGPIAVMGYAFESAAYLHLTNREGYPDFSFGRFGPYLARGIGPFLISLLYLVFFVPLYIAEQLLAGLIIGLVASMEIPFLALGVSFVLGAIILLVNATAYTVLWSLLIRGGLSGEIGDSFRFAFVGEFMKRAGGDGVLACLWLSLTLAPCLAAFFFAPQLLLLTIFPTIGVYFLCYAWLSCQLYRSYLTEKGPPFRVKCEIIED